MQPGMGTLFNLANCNVHIGKTATAWTQFLEVAAQAGAAGQADRESAARERAALLEKQLLHVTVSVAPSVVVDGLTVHLDSAAILQPSWNTPLPVDPGRHVLDLSAPGYSPWSTSVEVDRSAGDVSISIPPLARQPAAGLSSPQPVPPPAAAPPTHSKAGPGAPLQQTDSAKPVSRTTVGLVVGGAGIVLTGLGTYFALDAKSDYDSVAAQCPDNVCERGAYDRRTTARSNMRVATTLAGAGILSIGVGAWLLITAPSGQPPEPAASVSVAPGHVLVRGRF